MMKQYTAKAMANFYYAMKQEEQEKFCEELGFYVEAD